MTFPKSPKFSKIEKSKFHEKYIKFLEKKNQEKIDENLNFKFKAKKVPKFVKNNLFEQMFLS